VDILDNVMGANLFQFYFGTPIYNLMMKIPWKKLDWLRAKEEYCEVNRSFPPSQFSLTHRNHYH